MLVSNQPLVSYMDVKADNVTDEVTFGSDKLSKIWYSLVDIIASRIQRKNISELSKSLYESLFELRVEILQSSKANSAFHENVEAVSDKVEHLENTKIRSVFLDLIQRHQLVSEGILQDSITTTFPKEISYQSLSYYSVLTKSNYFKKMIDESLNFDCAALVIQLFLDRELAIPVVRIAEEVFPFMEHSISNLGKYAILADVWYPSDKQLEDPFFNRMKIKASIEQSKMGKVIPMSVENLKKMASS